MESFFSERKYLPDIEEEVGHFVNVEDVVEKRNIRDAIFTLLTISDDDLIKALEISDKELYHYSAMIERVEKIIKEEKIDPSAPWFNFLKDRLIRCGIYLPNSSRDKEKGRKEIESGNI